MNKIFVFLPDGVGLRNFAFTKFKEIGDQQGFEIVYWNNTAFQLKEEFGFEEIQVKNLRPHWKTDLLKRAKIKSELNVFTKKFKDNTFLTYNFKQSYKGLKNLVKSSYVDLLVAINSNEKGLQKMQSKMNEIERCSTSYKAALEQLKEHQPSFVFCTNQRTSAAIAPILAAKDLGIKTGTFIFSWDNLPKATKIVQTDFYFVWSEYMKQELLKYYPEVCEEQIIVSGTPQFEAHFDKDLMQSRTEFCEEYNLDEKKQYICFSGDDETTSPFDEYYLEDLVDAVNSLNEDGRNLGVIFRRCPADFSNRYKKAIEKYPNLVVSIDPIWKKIGGMWNTIMPTKEDAKLLTNTSLHSELVVNLASSMVFDFVAHNKSCIYVNYNQSFLKPGDKRAEEVYNYIHFRSMPSKDAVIWVNKKEELKQQIARILDGEITNVPEGKEWFKTINISDPTKASQNIWTAIQNIIS